MHSGKKIMKARWHWLILAAALTLPCCAFAVSAQTAAPTDSRRALADQAAAEGLRLFKQGTKDALMAAIGKVEEALALYRALDDKEQQAQMHFNLGIVWQRLGEMPKALEAYSQALVLYQSLANRKKEADTLNGLGNVAAALGETTRTQEHYHRALIIYKELGNKSGEANALAGLGLASRIGGELEKARQYHEQALALRRELGDQIGQGIALSSLGAVQEELGSHLQAIECFRQAIVLLRAASEKHHQANSLNSLGTVYGTLNDWPQARAQFEQGLALKREVGDKRGEAIALSQLGYVEQATGNSQRALELYRQALPLAREIRDRLTQSVILNYIGIVYRSLNDWPQALEHYEQSLALCRAVGERRRETVILKYIADVKREQGKLSEARDHIEQAIDLLEFIRAGAGGEEARSTFFASVIDFYDFQIDLLMRMNKAEPNADHQREALRISEQSRARSLLDLLNQSRADLRQGIDPALLAREQTLRKQLNASATAQTKLLNSKPTEAQTTAAAKEIATIISQLQQIEAQIRASHPRYAALTQPQASDPADIQRLLDDDTLLLEYALGEKHSFLWVVAADSITSYELAPRAEIEKATREVYALLNNRPPKGAALDPQFLTQAATLSHMLLGPAAAQLGKKRLVIVAPGLLAYLPLAALPAPDGPAKTYQPLMAAHEIVNLPSASVLSAIRRETEKRPSASRMIAILADPVFEASDPRVKSMSGKPLALMAENAALTRSLKAINPSSSRNGLARLAFSRLEAEAIFAIAPRGAGLKATDFTASRATATSEALGQYRLLHFATHGLLNNEQPELSGLVFSLVDEKGHAQDGFVRLHEVFNLRLNADLVVLSACETGLGKEIKGEGLIGLTRGFMYAGAPRVIASLWKVDDLATAELMRLFYQGLLRERKRPAEALRAAQFSMSRQKRWANPFFWSGFVLHGEWR